MGDIPIILSPYSPDCPLEKCVLLFTTYYLLLTTAYLLLTTYYSLLTSATRHGCPFVMKLAYAFSSGPWFILASELYEGGTLKLRLKEQTTPGQVGVGGGGGLGWDGWNGVRVG